MHEEKSVSFSQKPWITIPQNISRISQDFYLHNAVALRTAKLSIIYYNINLQHGDIALL